MLLQCYHHGCNIANAGHQAAPRCVFSRAIAAILLRQRHECIYCRIYVCSGYLVALPRPNWRQCRPDCCYMMIAMDSTPAACVAAPEWFWFWFGLLVLVNVVTEITLYIAAAATRHLLVLVTSSGHHIIILNSSSIEIKFSSKSILSELFLSRAEISSSTLSKHSQRRLKAGKALISPKEASQIRQYRRRNN